MPCRHPSALGAAVLAQVLLAAPARADEAPPKTDVRIEVRRALTDALHLTRAGAALPRLGTDPLRVAFPLHASPILDHADRVRAAANQAVDRARGGDRQRPDDHRNGRNSGPPRDGRSPPPGGAPLPGPGGQPPP